MDYLLMTCEVVIQLFCFMEKYKMQWRTLDDFTEQET